MTNRVVIYSYVSIIIVHSFLSLEGGYGFQSQYRHRFDQRWASTTATTTTSIGPYCSTSFSLLKTRTRPSSSTFYTPKYQSRNQQLQLKKTSSSTYQDGEESEAKAEPSEESNEIKDWLQNRLNMTDKQIELIYKHVGVFRPLIIDGDGASAISSRIEILDGRIDFLQKRLNVTDQEITKIFARHISILGYSSETIAGKLDWLQSRLDLDDKQLSTLVQRGGGVLQKSIEENLSPKLTWLQERLDLNTTQQLRTFVVQNPAALNLQTDSVEEKLNWYKNRFSFPDSEMAVKKIVRRRPTILGCDVESVDEKLSWLQNRLDLADSDLYRIIQLCPNILTSNVDSNLEPHLCFLASRFGLDGTGLRTMICKFPCLFTISSDNIEMKMGFYENLLGKDAAVRCIIHTPSYLSSSVEKRLEPRLVNVTDLGLVIGRDVTLRNFLKYTNEEWDIYMNRFAKEK